MLGEAYAETEEIGLCVQGAEKVVAVLRQSRREASVADVVGRDTCKGAKHIGRDAQAKRQTNEAEGSATPLKSNKCPKSLCHRYVKIGRGDIDHKKPRALVELCGSPPERP